MSWISEASLYGLLPVSMGAVAVAGMIAAGESLRRRRIQSLLETSGDAESLRQEIARIEQELTTRRAQLAEIDQREIEAKQRIAQASRLEAQIAELESRRDQLKEFEERTRAIRAEADDARVAREVAQSQTAELEQRRTALLSASGSLEARKQQLESELATSERAAEEVRRNLDALRTEATEATAQRHYASEQLAEAQLRRTVTETMLATATQKLEVLERRQEELSEIEQKLIQAKAELDQLVAASSEQRARAQATEEDLMGVKARSEFIKEEIEQLKLERSQVNGNSVDSAGEFAENAVFKRLADVWKPVFEKKQGLLPPASEADRLKEVRDYLRKNGLIFPDRVLYAFHTSLKVSNEATLLILAGISGTGKSLLPQRYAEGMGMNFQLVPVQPRWDGPQDLLGFYNFLQEKYVATDLIRAIAQMHEYPEDWNLPEDSRHISLKDQMLLVLLDEMNLARIEYYFSDLLVKLETRRTINPKIREQRIKASIELNAGPETSNLSRGIHVFPGSNCLFVGTMNEDESTQSISDKVVDRANVMRFARPRKLDGGATSPAPDPPSGRLSRAIWRSWQEETKLTDSEKLVVDSTIEKLNDALAGVERPFGHRVKRAIVQYVSLYPRSTTHAFKHAIADQIEMRILPKLRGIELDDRAQECLNAVEVLTREHDPELADAIQNALDRDSSRFHWLGISRDPDAN